jgi:hypothetical protein
MLAGVHFPQRKVLEGGAGQASLPVQLRVPSLLGQVVSWRAGGWGLVDLTAYNGTDVMLDWGGQRSRRHAAYGLLAWQGSRPIASVPCRPLTLCRVLCCRLTGVM